MCDARTYWSISKTLMTFDVLHTLRAQIFDPVSNVMWERSLGQLILVDRSRRFRGTRNVYIYRMYTIAWAEGHGRKCGGNWNLLDRHWWFNIKWLMPIHSSMRCDGHSLSEPTFIHALRDIMGCGLDTVYNFVTRTTHRFSADCIILQGPKGEGNRVDWLVNNCSALLSRKTENEWTYRI